MKIKEVNLILNDPKMQDKECNFKIVSKKTNPPKWFITYMDSFEKRINTRMNKFEKRINTRMYKFEKRINARFDNLVEKNNLIE